MAGAALLVALLVAIVGLAQKFPCAGLAHCFQLFSDALLAAACAASAGIITFFTSVLAVAAWAFALVSLKMIGYVSSAVAGRHCCIFRALPGLRLRQRGSSTAFSVHICGGD